MRLFIGSQNLPLGKNKECTIHLVLLPFWKHHVQKEKEKEKEATKQV